MTFVSLLFTSLMLTLTSVMCFSWMAVLEHESTHGFIEEFIGFTIGSFLETKSLVLGDRIIWGADSENTAGQRHLPETQIQQVNGTYRKHKYSRSTAPTGNTNTAGQRHLPETQIQQVNGTYRNHKHSNSASHTMNYNSVMQ